MLSGLSIRNVVLIDALDLEFPSGLTALTGETGAGKSIILDALGMATGARSDRNLVRAGTNKASVSASFSLPKPHVIWNILEEADFKIDPNEDVVLRRVINKDGRSKSYLNDSPISLKLLSVLGKTLLEVHGQYDGRGLMDTTTHMGLLDRFGGHEALCIRVEECYESYKTALKTLSDLQAQQNKSEDDQAFLEHSISELERLDPQKGEDEHLAQERKFLQHAQGALTELSTAQTLLSPDDENDFETRLSKAQAGLEFVRAKIGGKIDTEIDANTDSTTDESGSELHKVLNSACQSLEKVSLEIEEARRSVEEAAYAFDVEPSRLDDVEERLFALRAAARKYNVPVEGLTQLREAFAEQLSVIGNVDALIAKAQTKVDQTLKACHVEADKLSKARFDAALKLDKAIMKELPPLKMEKAKFETRITAVELGRNGKDSAIFHVSTNPGSPMAPIDKVASGGEMARLALATKVSLAESGGASLIFDEVDQGVGGAVADAVGKRLSRLSEMAQILVVTHSPQVAAKADHQFRIVKSSHMSDNTEVTTTSVTFIAQQEREEEIARMLAGESVTDAARAAARQLMAS